MNIAIIGSEGYIGKHLVHLLQKDETNTCYCYDIAPESSHTNYSQIDLTNRDSVNVLRAYEFDVIYLISGFTGTHNGFDEYKRFMDINELGLLNLLDVVRQQDKAPRIVFPSTRLVYKGKDKALKEEDEKETKTIYAVNKLACEHILYAFSNRFGIPYSVCRICVPYGNLLSNEYSFGTVGFFVKMAQAGKPISLYGGGDIKRTFTHVFDVCTQLIHAGSLQEGNYTFNIGGETFSLKEVATKVAHKWGTSVTTTPWPEKDLLIESDHTYFDDSKIKDSMGGYQYRSIDNFIEEI